MGEKIGKIWSNCFKNNYCDTTTMLIMTTFKDFANNDNTCNG